MLHIFFFKEKAAQCAAFHLILEAIRIDWIV